MAVQANTRKADKIAVGQVFAERLQENLPKANAERLMEEIHKLESKMSSIYSGAYGKYPKIENKPFYFFTSGNFYIVDPSRYECSDSGAVPDRVEEVPTTYFNRNYAMSLYNEHNSCPFYSGYNENGAKKIINKNGSVYYYIMVYDYDNSSSYPYYNYYIYNNGLSYGHSNTWSTQASIPNHTLRLPMSTVTGLKNAITYNLMPADLDEDEKKLFALLIDYNAKGWLTWNNNSPALSDDFYSALRRNLVDDFGDICLKKESAAEYIKNGNTVQLVGDEYNNFVQHLINVDNIRVNLSPYEESRLTDPNGGHWDLWSVEADENEVMINLNTAFYGRNPVADVKSDGIVGIDFGTKSTVVTVQNGTETIVPMRIGCGDYKKDVAMSDYENPTVIEFINLEKFCSNYNASPARPETEWVDMTISHTAADNLNSPQSGSEYYAWFSDLKQWASDKNRRIIIRDKQGKEVELSPFADISGDDLNPIELYAYLLGLFINNMYNGIYINYILSFPVTYERKIRQKIAASFEAGLKKSLPKAVQNDKKTMELFRVMEGASEPAAYAVCALQEYGFRPQENEKILYGIFDFGGGTTDFDFGTWQLAPKKMQRRYDYVIRHFGAGGDRLLGGENMLELLAYSVFKKNEAVLRSNDVQFIKPADADKYCGIFEGSEALINNSQQAKINQRQLAEELRPLWHGEQYTKDKVKLNLYNTKGEVATVELEVNVDELKALIRKRIDSGVENFFEAMSNAVTDEIAEGVKNFNIFLAGNSSKSEVVLQSFDYFQKKYEKEFGRKINVEVKEEIVIAEEVKKPDYFVKKYADKWNRIFELFLKYGVKIFEKLPEDDTFINELSAGGFVNIFYSITGNIISYDDLSEDLYELWAEGILTVSFMNDIVEEIIGNWNIDDEIDGILNFLYYNAEISEEIKTKIENFYKSYDGYELRDNNDISKKTTKVLEERKAKEKEKTKERIFVLYPPLGTAEADKIREDMGLPSETSVTRPTGKTGVAYGLLQCRPGSRIKVESEIKDTDEIKFNFYIGYPSMGKFIVMTDRDIEYGKWIEFIDAGESDFELYFTDLPEASGNQMSISGVSKKNCRIDETLDDAMVYIRAVEPSVIEYCAAVGEEELKKQEYLSAPKRIVLE